MTELLRILCVEDNPVNWRLVQRLLGQAGYEMHWAEEGLRGFEIALSLKPALVLLDINLPGLSGFEVATKFKQHPDLKDIPLIALTAKTLKSDRDTALVAGCDGFIPKPIDPFNFVKQVEGYLRGQRDYVEKAREGMVLRQFNVQMLAHLEAQLKQAQEANQKLLEAQQALEGRNQSLSRLLAMSQNILAERDPKSMLLHVMEQARNEVHAQNLCVYRLHRGGVYWEGWRWNGEAFEEAPILSRDHMFLLRAGLLAGTGPVHGAKLKVTRAWEEGISLGFWKPGAESSLLILKDLQDIGEVWGFWTFAREGTEPFLSSELELMSLHASLAQVALENAELFHSLDESSRALASSYERMEAAYQDLQNVRADLSRRDRQELMEDLFVKIAKRLEMPVATLNLQSHALMAAMGKNRAFVDCEEQDVSAAISEIQGAVVKVDGLLKALLRRAGREGTKPEWIDLHDLLQQEMELLVAEGVISTEAKVLLNLQAEVPLVHGVYSDFAKVFQYLAQHALGGPTPSELLMIRSWGGEETFYLEVVDEGGPIPPVQLGRAFEPFSILHQEVVMGVRHPGEGLASCQQILASYRSEISICNEGDGTLVQVVLPLK